MPRTYPQGVPCWVDLEVADLDAAQAFYAGLLGWSFHDAVPPQAPGSYLIATVDGRDVAAIGSPEVAMGAAGTPAWSTYVAVEDADTAARQVVELGGAVTSPPADAGPGGRAAACSDPDGVAFRLWQARRRLGAQHVNAPGGWNFSDLLADDPERSLAFYGGLFGWRSTALWEGGDLAVSVPGYGHHLATTSDPGIHERQAFAPQDFADVVAWSARVPRGDHPRWRVTFTVVDRDAAAAAAERLGGEVVGTAETEMTRAADLRDPLGAALRVSQFVPPGG
ncbi:VOC family protein [Streptomyces sp. NP160]|nr:VOC family protein [Streptomyces sp. NP160]